MRRKLNWEVEVHYSADTKCEIVYREWEERCGLGWVQGYIRQVAVYLRTHCNIGSKRAFPTGVLDS